MHRTVIWPALVIAVSIVLYGCGDDDSASDAEVDMVEPEIGDVTESELYANVTFSDPTNIDNEWFPLTPGTRLTYEGTTVDEGEFIDHIVITTVTDLTKVIDGVETVVIWDQDFSDEELVETEIAFFAQDDNGNVWRFGEYPEEYDEGVLVEAPAWLAGHEDAVAGVAMWADPWPGSRSYSQGWGPEVDFIDRGQVNRRGEGTCVPVKCWADVLIIDEFNVEEPGAFQTKWFTRGVGNIRVGWYGDDESQEELELVEWVDLRPSSMDVARAAAYALEESAYATSEVYGETAPLQE